MTSDEKLQNALAYLGTRHVLHKHYSGRISHDPMSADVRKTVRKARQQLEAERKAQLDKIINIRVAK